MKIVERLIMFIYSCPFNNKDGPKIKIMFLENTFYIKKKV